jgi:MFS family permease
MARRKVYDGWTNLGLAALAMVATLPGRTQGLGLVTEPLIADLGLDRVAYAEINLWATLVGAAFCIPCGRLLDRFGSRLVLTTVLAALGVTVIAMSASTGLVALAIAVTLTRGFGQSALSVASLALVGKWFSRRLNVAMGVFSVLVGVGFIAAFPAVGQSALAFGWRSAWLAVGLVQVVVLAPLVWLFVRNDPEGQGLVVDGDVVSNGVPNGDSDASPPVLAETASRSGSVDLTVWEAVRSSAFWIFALSSSLFGLAYSGISLFNQSILEERGFDATTFHQVLVISTFVGLAANFGGGVLATRWPIQRVMAVGMAVLAAALVGLPMVETYLHVVLYGVAMGTAGGVVTVVFFSVWGQVFGRRHLGRIQGCAQMMTVFASALGPLLLAETLERTGSYAAIFHVMAVAVVVLGIGCWCVTVPSRSARFVERAAIAGAGS